MLFSRSVGGCVLLSFLLLAFIYGVMSDSSLRNRALELMKKYPLIDGHNDLALRLRILHNNQLSKVNLHTIKDVATDINRLIAGHVGGEMFAAYVMCTAQGKDAVRLTLEQIDLLRRMCTESPEMELITTAEGLNNTKRIGCLLSVEGGHSIDSSLPTLRMLYQLGVRSMALTHSCNTPWAESSSKYYLDYRRENNSLTEFGKAVVSEMNRLGMIIDLSHSSWATAKATMDHSRAPVIFSHSSAYKICNHTRNVPDDLLLQLKKNKGLIMVNFHDKFIVCHGQASVSTVADHFDHFRHVVGAEMIGIGGDFDGAVGFPQGLEDVSHYPALIQELLRRGWTEEELAAVLRLNFIRVFKEVEKVRDSLRDTPPSEVEIPFAEANNSCRLILRPPGIATVGGVHARNCQRGLVTVNALIWTILLVCGSLS
ncbi:dipeptidase 3 [Chanos chanos]|uniref:Dipeptidase n=1 Tax=Chanos chanos TaxID=29144 RepID=A0A6J2UQB9_CHACN|nr:dipeptidase 3-like [Chanos chanos]